MNYNLPDGLYCMYLRKSRADRDSQLYDEQEILSRHEMILKETAEKMGIRIGKIYTEIVSGETIAETNRNKSGNATAKTSGSAMSNVKISLRRHKAERSFIMSARSALENSL